MSKKPKGNDNVLLQKALACSLFLHPWPGCPGGTTVQISQDSSSSSTVLSTAPAHVFVSEAQEFSCCLFFYGHVFSCFIEVRYLTYYFICWFRSLTFKNRKRLEHIVRLCSKVMTFRNLPNLYEVRATTKAKASGRHYVLSRTRTSRSTNSLVPATTALLDGADMQTTPPPQP